MVDAGPDNQSIAIVIIGRNEGMRLQAAIESSLKITDRVVYADSGSSDESAALAGSRGLQVVELDDSAPHTAARGRNAGFAVVRDKYPGTEFVQFLDGDCELSETWAGRAVDFLSERPDAAIVCGRLRERFPDKSVYNLLCDIEWNVPAGETDSCGGIFCVRFDAFEQAGGFREQIVAGEELEFCTRVRAAGWKIWRLEDEMALHDAGMSKFSQWWKRAVRCGFTYAQGAHELGRDSRRQRNRALLWGGLLPIAIIVLTAIFGYKALFLLLVYPLQAIRLSLGDGLELSHSLLNSVFAIIEKFPEMLGVARFYFNRVFRVRDRLIEYK